MCTHRIPSTQSAYLCLQSNTGRVYISRHIKFDETVFPFQCPSPPPPAKPTPHSPPQHPLATIIPILPPLVSSSPGPTSSDLHLQESSTIRPSTSTLGVTDTWDTRDSETLASAHVPHYPPPTSPPINQSPNQQQHNPNPGPLTTTAYSSNPSPSPPNPITIQPHTQANISPIQLDTTNPTLTNPNPKPITQTYTRWPKPTIISTPSPTPLDNPISHNNHPMINCRKNNIHKQNTKYNLSISLSASIPPKPQTVNQALKDQKWRGAMSKEMDAFARNQTFDLVPRQPNQNVIGCKWTFKNKFLPNGSVNRRKMRLDAKGYSQQFGKDYTDTFSPVIKSITLHLFSTLLSLTHGRFNSWT